MTRFREKKHQQTTSHRLAQKTNIQRVNITFIRFEGDQVRGPGLIVHTDLIQLYKEFEAMGRIGGYIYFDNAEGGRIGFNLSRYDQYSVQVLPLEDKKADPEQKFDIEGKAIKDVSPKPSDATAITDPSPTPESNPKV